MYSSDKINESYYAKDNNPSFYQFKKTYHFYDDYDRQYIIASKNGQVLQNTRFKSTRDEKKKKVPEPVINNYGYAKLYVKLADPASPWFSRTDINKPLILHERTTGEQSRSSSSSSSIIVELMSHEKVKANRRTGTVFLKGVDKETLVRLLKKIK
jgi:hypothetical protein